MKLYTFKTINGSQHFLKANNNKEVMKLVSVCCSYYGDIVWLKDENNRIIIENKGVV